MSADRFCFSCQKRRPIAGFLRPPNAARDVCEYCNPDRIVGYDKGRPITKREQLAAMHATARRQSESLRRRGILGAKLERVFKGTT